MISILVVCTGNMFRSPMGEYMLRDALAERGLVEGKDFFVESVGTHVVRDGAGGISRGAAYELKRRGIDASGHQARRLTFERIDAADLILTMEVGHVREVVAQNFEARHRVLLLNEAASASRGEEIDKTPDPALETADPIGGTPEMLAMCAHEMETALDAIAEDLAGADSKLIGDTP